MKLASYKHGRDGKLMVVSRDLLRCIEVADIASTMQQAIDNWHNCAPKLQRISDDLNSKKISGQPFGIKNCASPLPRAYQWLDGSAYINHVELARKARGAEIPPNIYSDPLMYQGGSDAFLGPLDDITFPTEDYGVDFEAEIAIVTNDVAMGTSKENAADHIKLLMLVNDISLRYIAQEELQKGFGFVQGKPPNAFSPVAVTPDELGTAWQDCKINLTMQTFWNGQEYGHPNAATDMIFNFADLIAHATKTRPLAAGTIIGSGTISNRDRATGHCCIVEKRMVEKIETGKSITGFMKFGDTVRITMNDTQGQPIFGSIEQTFKKAG